jgi:hypothetical protein
MPANMANPCSGSDVAARELPAALSAAVVQRPLVASKMSTTLRQLPAQAQRISAHLQRLKARLLPPNTRPHHTPSHNINNSNKNYIPLYPPANMANPCSGSDVAARKALATLSAAVVQLPLVALNTSTALLKSPAHEKRISAHLQRLG